MHKLKIFWAIILLFTIQTQCFGKTNSDLIRGRDVIDSPCINYMNVVAHQDDDLLFMNPDIMERIQKGCVIETVYLTAGDKDRSQRYWLGREAGVKEAYSYMAKVNNDWVEEDLELYGHKLVRFILKQKPKINLVFLRLPDGIASQNGVITLKTIWQYDQLTINSKDQKNIYRKYELVKILKGLMDYYKPGVIEYVYPGCHVDHQYTAKFTELAELLYLCKHKVIRYRDYNITKSPPNLDEFNARIKWIIAQRYAKHDWCFPRFGFERLFRRYYGWCERQYYYQSNEWTPTQGKIPSDVLYLNKSYGNWPKLNGKTFRTKLVPVPKSNLIPHFRAPFR